MEQEIEAQLEKVLTEAPQEKSRERFSYFMNESHYSEMGGSYSLAEKILLHLLKENPANPAIYLNLALMVSAQGRKEEAEGYRAKARDLLGME